MPLSDHQKGLLEGLRLARSIALGHAGDGEDIWSLPAKLSQYVKLAEAGELTADAVWNTPPRPDANHAAA